MERPEIEFRHAGHAHIARPSDPETADDEVWTAYLYWRDNPKGDIAERWYHVHGCERFFNAQRNTTSDTLGKTYKPGEAP